MEVASPGTHPIPDINGSGLLLMDIRPLLDRYDLGPSVALVVPEMVGGGGIGVSSRAIAAGSAGFASCCAASAVVRLVSASGPAAKPASARILSMIGRNAETDNSCAARPSPSPSPCPWPFMLPLAEP